MPRGRPKLPPKVVQKVDFAPMPPARGFVRSRVLAALKERGIKPVEGTANVTVTWVERDHKHTHAQISAGVLAILDTLVESGVIGSKKCAFLDSRQRLSTINPHIEVVIEGRVADGARAYGSKVLTEKEREGRPINDICRPNPGFDKLKARLS